MCSRVLCETVKDFVAQVGKAHSEKEEDTDMANKVRTCLGEYRVGGAVIMRNKVRTCLGEYRVGGAVIMRKYHFGIGGMIISPGMLQ